MVWFDKVGLLKSVGHFQPYTAYIVELNPTQFEFKVFNADDALLLQGKCGSIAFAKELCESYVKGLKMSVFDQRDQKVYGRVINVAGGVKSSNFDWVQVVENWILILRPYKAVVLSDGSFDVKKGDTIVLSGKCTSVNIAKAVVDTFLIHEIN